MVLSLNRIGKTAVIAALFALPFPAGAQDRVPEVSDLQTGTRFKAEPENARRDEARDLQKRVARCVVYRDTDFARKVLVNSDPASIHFHRLGIGPDTLMDDLKLESCIGRARKHQRYSVHMRFQFRTLRALMAEEVYLRDHQEPLALASNAEAFIKARGSENSMHPVAYGMAKLADCIVFNGIAASDALLRSRPGSDKEAEAIVLLHPALSKCGLGGQKEVALDYSMVRQVVADGMWSRCYYQTMNSTAEGEDDA